MSAGLSTYTWVMAHMSWRMHEWVMSHLSMNHISMNIYIYICVDAVICAYLPLFLLIYAYPSLLQKSPIKETISCKETLFSHTHARESADSHLIACVHAIICVYLPLFLLIHICIDLFVVLVISNHYNSYFFLASTLEHSLTHTHTHTHTQDVQISIHTGEYIYIHTHVCAHTHKHTHKCSRTHTLSLSFSLTHSYTHTNTHSHTHTHASHTLSRTRCEVFIAFIRVCMHAYMYMCMHACMYFCMYFLVHIVIFKSIHTCMNTHMYTCMHSCMHTWIIYIFIHICIYL